MTIRFILPFLGAAGALLLARSTKEDKRAVTYCVFAFCLLVAAGLLG